ncbi:winged helix-turn-helix transcriptional regulator [Fulvivirgaceae bacterium BMA12]|uniref:Winged helix-turn-helix transcriptional regulator n=1 Tax=Agaribacillus aureus TaxID=3051825 RepID=A0ABT8KYN0_9BACT|nr:winged helix-turn-helix transcriptional regulator [Fulvivirgaceae bacterium BMA12]
MNPLYQIDSIDSAILSYLAEDGKMPYTEMAKKITVSHGTIHQRVKKMEKMGIIQKTSVVIDYNKLGYKLTCYLGVLVNSGLNIDKVCQELKNIPQITVANITSGKFNITCKIRALDADHAKHIIQNIHSIDGVIRTETTVSFEEFINSKDQLIQEIAR